MAEPQVAASPAPRRWSDLGARAASGLVLVAAAIVTTWLGGEIFVVFWLAAAIAVLWEWQRLIGAPAARRRVWLGALALTGEALLARTHLPYAAVLIVAAALVLGLLAGAGRRLWSGGGMLYAGLLLLATIGLRHSEPDGGRALVWLFATVWSTDTFAYFGGRLIGGPKLSPRISPSKTWSGTGTGLLAGGLIGTFAATRGLGAPTAVVPILLVTLVASLCSQAGDAFESAMKRRFGVKDSSRLIPGHGGVMDRLDGFVTAASFALALGLARNLASVASGLFHWA